MIALVDVEYRRMEKWFCARSRGFVPGDFRFDRLAVFVVDQQPAAANWEHDYRYDFVSEDAQQIRSFDARVRPHESFRLHQFYGPPRAKEAQ